MGAQITRELGLYNEEERVCTPKTVGPQRYRMLTNDPRSVTMGITRTPIQVECTPTGTKSLARVTSKTKKSCLDHVENNSEGKKDSDHKEEVEFSNTFKEENKSDSPISNKYLETDIDKLDSPQFIIDPSLENINQTSTDIGNSNLITQDKLENNLGDIISPSLQKTRTPHLVECTPELFALHSRIDSLTFCDFDTHTDDPSAIVSDDDQASLHNQSSLNQWLADVENTATQLNDSFIDSPRQVAKNQKDLNALKKQLFFTPDVGNSDNNKPKARTPLGNIQAGQLQEAPQRMMKYKQWRNIQEERQRRGLMDSENTPPNLALPPLSNVSSAPCKIVERRRSKKINWDSENAMLI